MRREAVESELAVGDMLEASDFDVFAIRHLREVLHHRFFAKEWTPEAQAAIRGMTLADVACEAAPTASLPGDGMAVFATVPAMRLVEATYIARHNAAWRMEMSQKQRALLDALLEVCGMPEGEGLAASLVRMLRRHFWKDDFRRIAFSREWEVLTVIADASVETDRHSIALIDA